MGRRGLYDRRLAARNERWTLAGRTLAAALSRPELVLAVARHTDAVERGGRVLNRGVQALLVLTSALERASSTSGGTDPVETRDMFTGMAKLAMPVRTDVHVTGRRLPGPDGAPAIPVRVYRRFGTGIGRGPRPGAITYFHGGGWVVGDLDSHDASCRLLAAVTGCVVVAVDYRLAPEHPYPAAVEDALAAYAWVHANHRDLGTAEGVVGVMGDSAGGNLAAVVALSGRDGTVPAPVAQGLVYPALDARLDTPSIHEFAEGFFLTREGMEAYRAHYVPDPATWETWQASPVLADDKRGVAPALVVTAGFDPLRDEGASYARALVAVDVDVEYRCYDVMVHGFFGMGVVPDCLALATEVCDAMGALMRRAAQALRDAED
jgi:acetyl esterase